jgi:hypothetical protein
MSNFPFPDRRDAALSKAVIGSQQYMQMTPTRDLYPSGFFNERKRGREGGPTETLAEKAPRANNMRDGINRNLIHTQLAARVNVTRYILPLKLPNVFASPGSIEVKKTFVSGDVMFALRYTSAMFTQGIATDITRKPPPLHMTGVNLPTLNYILVNYQLYVWDHMHPFTTRDNYDKSKREWKNYFSSLYTGLLERNNFMDRNLEELHFELMACGDDMLAKNVLMQVHVWKFIRNFVHVAGVFIGSEEQGGQNQGMANPASHNPIDFMGACVRARVFVCRGCELAFLRAVARTRNARVFVCRGPDLLCVRLFACCGPDSPCAFAIACVVLPLSLAALTPDTHPRTRCLHPPTQARCNSPESTRTCATCGPPRARMCPTGTRSGSRSCASTLAHRRRCACSSRATPSHTSR